jgi:SNF2 family DNA or RNA helicase
MEASTNKLTASLAVDEKGNRVIWISFPYDLDIIFKMRTLPNRKYHAEFKCWSSPIYADTIDRLKEWGFFIDANLTRYIQKRDEKVFTTEKKNTVTIEGIPGLKGKLYPFQKKGVAFLESHNGRALIADEMGLGKTVQALAWLQLHPEKRPVIIVVPASVKLNWTREALTWVKNPKVEILAGQTPWKPEGQIIIINYDILTLDWVRELKKLQPQVLITDECHYYKSNTAKRTKAIKRLVKGIPHVIALSGTPILNRPIEVYNAVNIINPALFPDYWSFTQRYCNRRHTGFGWDVSGHSHEKELHDLLTESIMLRRLKADVLPDLPSKVLSFVPIVLHNKNEYRAAEADFIAFIRQTKGVAAAIRASNAKVLAEIEGLKQLCVKGKLKEATNWIQDFLDSSDQKLVVFAVHRFVIDELMSKFGDIAVKIDGSVSLSDRQKAVDNFQHNDRVRVFIGNIKAAGVGLTLTAASNVAFLELPWTPGDLVQAEDRVHRIGQKGSVTIYYLLAMDTIEEKIANLLDLKRKVLDTVLDGKETDQESLFSELIKMYE